MCTVAMGTSPSVGMGGAGTGGRGARWQQLRGFCSLLGVCMDGGGGGGGVGATRCSFVREVVVT